jgi:hypothetical protein
VSKLQIFSPHEWVPIGTALAQIKSSTGQPDLASQYYDWDMRSGRLRFGMVPLSPDGKGRIIVFNPSEWGQPHGKGHCFVRRVELDKRYPIAATPTLTAAHPSDDTRPSERRRGPVLKHQWHAIDGEIARRCINPKTRLLKIPKSERKLAKDLLGWCHEKYEKEPAESEMREAVKAICAALRAHK